jgi:large subunit ribosomal protein L24
MKIKKGDTVEVIAGDDKGVKGTVRLVIPGQKKLRGRMKKGQSKVEADHTRDRAVISGVNLVKKHQRPTGDVRTQVGIIEREAPVKMSKLALVCPHCQQRTRAGYEVLESGDKVRRCKRCGQTIE